MASADYWNTEAVKLCCLRSFFVGLLVHTQIYSEGMSFNVTTFQFSHIWIASLWVVNCQYCTCFCVISLSVFFSQRNGLWKDAADAKADFAKAEYREKTHSRVHTPAHTPVSSKVIIRITNYKLLWLASFCINYLFDSAPSVQLNIKCLEIIVSPHF